MKKKITFGKIAETSRSRYRWEVVFANPQQVLTLAAGVEAALLQVSRSQEGAGIKTLPWKLDNLLGFNPTTINKLEAFQVNNLVKMIKKKHKVSVSVY